MEGGRDVAVEGRGSNDGRKRRINYRTSRMKWNNITDATNCKTTHFRITQLAMFDLLLRFDRHRNWMFSGHCSLDGAASRLSHT